MERSDPLRGERVRKVGSAARVRGPGAMDQLALARGMEAVKRDAKAKNDGWSGHFFDHPIDYCSMTVYSQIKN